MRSTDRSFNAPINPVPAVRIALPAILALTILSLPVVDPANAQGSSAQRGSTSHGAVASGRGPTGFATIPKGGTGPRGGAGPRGGTQRSEEHTSELQSRDHLVCRLLRE